jgi:hypothetical protein
MPWLGETIALSPTADIRCRTLLAVLRVCVQQHTREDEEHGPYIILSKCTTSFHDTYPRASKRQTANFIRDVAHPGPPDSSPTFEYFRLTPTGRFNTSSATTFFEFVKWIVSDDLVWLLFMSSLQQGEIISDLTARLSRTSLNVSWKDVVHLLRII